MGATESPCPGKLPRPALPRLWSLGPPLPFRAAPDKGRGQMIHERICNVKLNLQIFWIFFAESLGTRMGSGIAGFDFFAGWRKNRLRVFRLRAARYAETSRRYGAKRCTHLRRGAAVRCWKRGVTDMALGAAGQATTQAPQPMQRAGFM